MLTKKQQKTIDDLKKYRGITKSSDIIKWCLVRLKLPFKKDITSSSPKRKHTRTHYREIILHLRRTIN